MRNVSKLGLLELHPQFLTDRKGNKTAVQLPLKEFEELMRLFEDLEDIVDLEQARLHPEETVAAADFWTKVEAGE